MSLRTAFVTGLVRSLVSVPPIPSTSCLPHVGTAARRRYMVGSFGRVSSKALVACTPTSLFGSQLWAFGPASASLSTHSVGLWMKQNVSSHSGKSTSSSSSSSSSKRSFSSARPSFSPSTRSRSAPRQGNETSPSEDTEKRLPKAAFQRRIERASKTVSVIRKAVEKETEREELMGPPRPKMERKKVIIDTTLRKAGGRVTVNKDLGTEERLERIIARAGMASRRGAKDLIQDGLVTVNEKLVLEPGAKVNVRKDTIYVNGKPLVMRNTAYWIMMNKPKDFITTNQDDKGRKTVFDLVKTRPGERLVACGRLDRDSTGLLFLTNDYEYVTLLTHPRYNHVKYYRVDVVGRMTTKTAQKLADGVFLPGEKKKTRPCVIRLVSMEKEKGTYYTTLEIELQEGKCRQIRRMMELVDHPVIRLHRYGYANLKLDVKRGEHRMLTQREITALRKYADKSRKAHEEKMSGASITQQDDSDTSDSD